MGIHAQGDIVSNIDGGNFLPPSADFQHGTWVASVLAARGNDGRNIAGMMWNSRLRLYDVAALDTIGKPVRHDAADHAVQFGGHEISDSYKIQDAVIAIVDSGVRVVNISLGSNSSVALTGPHSPAQDTARFGWGHFFATQSRKAAIKPLYVISAGNMQNATDVYWE